MGDDDVLGRPLRAVIYDDLAIYRRRRARHEAIVGALIACAIFAFSIAFGRSLRAARPAVTDLADLDSKTHVNVDLVFSGGLRFTVTRLRLAEPWPSSCATCGRDVSPDNAPLEMWSGADGRRVFAGCFACWKTMMSAMAADMKAAGLPAEAIAFEASPR